MKTVVIIVGITILGGVGYFLGSRPSSVDTGTNKDVLQQKTEQGDKESSETSGEMVRGRVMDISEEEIIVGLYKEQDRNTVDREKMESMSDSERQAFREGMRSQREAQGAPEIIGEKVLTLTNNTVYIKSTGRPGQRNRSNKEGERGVFEGEEITHGEIKEDAIVNVIIKDDTQEVDRLIVQMTQI